jgi:hypothetical protein
MANCIRAIGRRKHACIGDTLQLYTAMRTKKCKLIGKAECTAVYEIEILFDDDEEYEGVISRPPLVMLLDEFARRDGFKDWSEMKAFWREHHPETVRAGEFKGLLIQWGPLLQVGDSFQVQERAKA